MNVGAMQVTITDGDDDAVTNALQTLHRNEVSAACIPLTDPPADSTASDTRSLASEPQQMRACKKEAQLSASQQGCKRTQATVQVSRLRWGAGTVVPADLILAADVVYDPDVLPDLVAQLAAQLTCCPGATALVAAVQRNPETAAGFVRQCRAAGMTVATLETAVTGRRTASGDADPQTGANGGSDPQTRTNGGPGRDADRTESLRGGGGGELGLHSNGARRPVRLYRCYALEVTAHEIVLLRLSKC